MFYFSLPFAPVNYMQVKDMYRMFTALDGLNQWINWPMLFPNNHM